MEEIAAAERNSLVGGPFGSNLVSTDYVAEGVPVIRGQNMASGRWVTGEFAYVSSGKAERLSPNMARPGDIVFTQRGTLGQVAIVPAEPYERYVVSQSQMKLTVNRSIADPLFIYYVFTSGEQRDYIRRNAIQTGVPHTNLEILRSTPILLPPLQKQLAIAGILGSLDTKIDLNRRMNATLETIARSIFKSWFVDFDPVRAKAKRRQPAGMDAETASLFPARFSDSDAGLIPSNWTNATIAEVAGINDWTLSEKDEFPRLEYVEISGVMKGDILETTWYERPAAPSRARRRLRHGDTVLSTVRPDRGAYFLALHPHEQMIASTGFAVITPRSVPWSFLYCVATQKELFEHLGVLADGGAYPAVSPEIIGKWDLWLPANGLILARFHSICAPLLEQAEANRRMSQTLVGLRDALLPRLLSGELRIRDAEKIVEAHV